MASNAVQIVAKASSDELLKKFAEVGEDEDRSQRRRSSSSSAARDALRVMVIKRQRRSVRVFSGIDDDRDRESAPPRNRDRSSRALARDQRKCLISRSGVGGDRRSSPAMLRRLGLIRAGEFKSKSFLEAIEKTWRKTVEGASKMFIERHYYYDQHKRLISDVA